MILVPYTIFIISALLLILFLYLLRWRDYRLFRKWKENASGVRPGISVVIPAHNQALQLQENLIHFLKQDYDTFEVIVVDIHSSDETPEVIKRLENFSVPLRCVKLPATSRYIGKNRLAMSLGIRAAHFPWVVFTQPDCRPKGSGWLAAIAEMMTDERNIVLGYANYEDEKGHSARRAVYCQLRTIFRNLRALQRGRAISADIRNLAIRKSFYMEKHPLSGKLTMPFGEASLIADSYGQKAHTAFAASPEAVILQNMPHRRTLSSLRMYSAEICRHLSFRSKLYRLRDSLASWCVFLLIILFISYTAMRVFELMSSEVYDMEMLFYDVPMLLLLVLSILLPLLLMRSACRVLDIRSFSLRPLWYEITQPLRNLYSKLQRWHHRKEFVRPIMSSTEYNGRRQYPL